jgi:SAM-dependent methyltransferase
MRNAHQETNPLRLNYLEGWLCENVTMHPCNDIISAGKCRMMESFDRKKHWEQVYEGKSPLEVSWFQAEPSQSLRLIQNTGIAKADHIVDVGGGASVLVDRLQGCGFENLTVLDISSGAIEHAKRRLGEAADNVEWHEADITVFDPPHSYALWHDRAVFHFLTQQSDREKYVEVMKHAVPTNSHIILATFSIGGPEKCSGLDIVQYDASKLLNVLGDEFRIVEVVDEVHMTPGNREQNFSYFRLERL